MDAAHGVAHCPTTAALEAAFEAADAAGLVVGAALITSPTYFGAVAHVTGGARTRPTAPPCLGARDEGRMRRVRGVNG